MKYVVWKALDYERRTDREVEAESSKDAAEKYSEGVKMKDGTEVLARQVAFGSEIQSFTISHTIDEKGELVTKIHSNGKPSKQIRP